MADNSVFSGKSNSLLVGEEASYGAGGTADKDLGYISRATLTQTEEFEEVPSIGARNVQENVRTKYRVRGSIEGVYQHGRILYYALGAVSHAGGTDPYTHTITEADVLPSLVLQAAKSFSAAGVKNTVVGVKIDSLRVQAEKNSLLKWNAEWIGKSNTRAATTASQTLDDIVPPAPSQIAVYTGADAANPTTELAGVYSWEFNIANNLEPVDPMNSVVITDLVEGDRRYTGRITLPASNAAETVKQLSLIMGTDSATTPQNLQTERAIKFYWANGISPVDAFTTTLYGCTFNEISDPYEKGGIMVLDLPFKAKSLGACSTQDDIASASW